MYSHLLPRADRSPSHPSLPILALSLGLLTLSAASSASPDRAASKASDQQLHSQAVLAKTPLFFEPNRGQFAKSVDFAVRTPMIELSLQDTEAHIWLPNDGPQATGEKLVVKPIGAQVQATGWQGEEQQLGLSHYYEGNDVKQWFTDIPHYGRVKYRNLYKGIDLVYYGNPTQLEYDFVLAPHADPRQIALAYTGAQAISLTKDGDAQLTIGQQTLVQHRPIAYQMINGKRQAVDAQYVITATPEGKQTGLSFKLAAYNSEHSLVIDPVLSYGSFVGGTKGDWSSSLGLDKQGAMYIGGHTESSNFAGQTSGSLQSAWDTFVSKFDKTGKLVWTSFLRGSKNEYNREIAVTEAGKVYLMGSTESANFPTTSGALDRNLGGTWDVFVAHLTLQGKLAYSTYLGGSGEDGARSLAVNKQGDLYLTGYTYSSDFPTTANAIDHNLSGTVDGFFAKINAKGASLLYSTYLGGATEDYGNKIAIDSSNQAYIIGQTGSGDFPVTSTAFDQTHNGNYDAFVTKFTAAGGLSYSTYLGGTEFEIGSALAVDSKGQVYAVGRTLSADFPTANAFDRTYAGGGDVFITKLIASGAGLSYSSYLGGSLEDRSYDIALTSTGEAYLVGSTASADFPIANTWASTSRGKKDAYVAKISANGASIAYSGLLAGRLDDEASSVSLLGSSVYITGVTDSAKFPTTVGAYDRSFNGVTDGFLAIVR